MNPESFANDLYLHVVLNNIAEYQTILESPLPNGTMEYWLQLHEFYQSLSRKEQDLILKLIRQVSVDAIASISA